MSTTTDRDKKGAAARRRKRAPGSMKSDKDNSDIASAQKGVRSSRTTSSDSGNARPKRAVTKKPYVPKHADGALVSVIMFVRNGMPHVKRAIESVLNQEYDNLEFVIQDGLSTDGTREYLESLDDDRIKLVSKRDKGPADAFAKAMARAKGDIIASCLADEELYPTTLMRVVETFKKFPYLGAITGDADISDIHGRVYAKFEGEPFNLLKYLDGSYCPYWCSSFFSRNALEFVGIFDKRWSTASLEFEVWCRLAMETDILYLPEIFSKYAHHSEQLSQAGDRAAEEIEARLEIIKTRLFGRGTYFGEDYGQRDVFCLLQLINLHRHLSDWDPKAAQSVLNRIEAAGYLGEFNMLERAAELAPVDTPPLAEGTTPAPVPALAVPVPAVQEPAAAEPVSDKFVPMHEFIVPEDKISGKLYRAVTPSFVRRMIPRGFKISLARGFGLRK